MCTAILAIYVHEMFHTFRGCIAGSAAVAQILDKARVVRGKPPELGPRHSGFAQEALDPGDQHEGKAFLVGGESAVGRILFNSVKSYLSRKNTSAM